jgi:beta-1,4-mannosyl-glycoprotein beta-1,4-N-acetylglucosaminyltransferase
LEKELKNTSRKIFDVFPFSNEIDLLEIRMHILDDIVDYFVISEFDTSFAGIKKPYYYEENQSKFESFSNKIIYSKKSQLKIGNSFENDDFQKNSISQDLLNFCKPNDIIIYGDLDEIPNPTKIQDAIDKLSFVPICHFAQENFMYYLNNKEISGKILSFAGEYDGIKDKKWLGTIVTTYSHALKNDLTNLRFPFQKQFGHRIENGGWHFSYVGSNGLSASKRLKYKLEHSTHQEFNSLYYRLIGYLRILRNKDFYGLRKSKFELVKIDESYPKYLINNIEKYSYLIK